MAKKIGALLLFLAILTAGFFIGVSHAHSRAVAARHVLFYEDPMHPAYRSANPGIAPDCGMDLVPVYAEDLGHSLPAAEPHMLGLTQISPRTRQLYGIQLSNVEQSSGESILHVYGRVVADETRVFRVDLGTEGYVKETSGDAVGNHVTKDQHLAMVYSPDFLAAAGGYLSATERVAGVASKDNIAAAQNATSSQARADRLRNLGMSDVQINEITTNRKIPEDVYVVSPTDGFIISREISSGMRFEKHAELYRIADLSHVWILADVFGKDALAFRPATIARVTLPDTGESFTARVSNGLPQLDPSMHTLRPRLELSNPAFHLRPGMFVEIELHAAKGFELTIPVDAVVNTGLAKRVFVQISEGSFEERQVETGWSSGDRVQIVRGLQRDEKVVSAGTFLVDSESRMRRQLGAIN